MMRAKTNETTKKPAAFQSVPFIGNRNPKWFQSRSDKRPEFTIWFSHLHFRSTSASHTSWLHFVGYTIIALASWWWPWAKANYLWMTSFIPPCAAAATGGVAVRARNSFVCFSGTCIAGLERHFIYWFPLPRAMNIIKASTSEQACCHSAVHVSKMCFSR